MRRRKQFIWAFCPDHYSDCVVVQKPRPVVVMNTTAFEGKDAQSYRVAGGVGTRRDGLARRTRGDWR